MHSFLRQSTASQSRSIGPFLDDTDFKTEETGLTIANTDIKLMINGAASANKNSGGGTHRANGVYGITFDATDTATVGEIFVSVKVAGALAVFATFVVLEEAIYDALFAASANAFSGAAGSTTLTALATGSITAAVIANNAIDAATFAADVDAEILSYLVDDATRIDASALNTLSGHDPGEAIMGATDLGTGAGLTSLASATNLATVDTVVDAIKAKTDNLPSDPADESLIIAATDAIASAIAALNNLSAAEVNAEVDTAITDAALATAANLTTVDTVVDAIKAKTDSLTFTSAGIVDANVQQINDVTITGDGQVGTEFGV
jgi:hypothetical protein